MTEYAHLIADVDVRFYILFDVVHDIEVVITFVARQQIVIVSVPCQKRFGVELLIDVFADLS
jgi:hypothetical protein